jgi:amino acid transporter, AAT family
LAHKVQGWSSVIPRFSAVDFLSFYIELLVMAFMYFLWLVVHRLLPGGRSLDEVPQVALPSSPLSQTTMAEGTYLDPAARSFFDFVDASRVDLYRDEHEDTQFDKHEDEDARARRLRGRARWAWALYYIVA